MLNILILLIGSVEAAPPVERVRVDYVPAVIYEDETVHLHLSVLPELKIGDSLKLLAKSTGASVRWKASLKPDEKGTIQIAVSPDKHRGVNRIEIEWKRKTVTVDQVAVRLMRAAEGLPVLEASGNGLRDHEDTRCVVLAEHRIRHHGRTWLPIRFLHSLVVKKPPPRRTLILSDLDLELSESEDLKFVHAAPGSSRPIYQAIAKASSIKKVGADSLMVLFIGNRDLQAGTEPLEFRMGMEAVLQHLSNREAEEILIVQPIGSPSYRDRQSAFRERVNQVAHIYRHQPVLNIDGKVSPDIWRTQAGSPITLRWPGSESLKPVADYLAAKKLNR